MVYNEIVNIKKKGGENMRNSINYEENPAILNDFLEYLRNMRNYSIGTIKGYENDLNIFFKFILKYKHIQISFSKITIFTIFQIAKSDIIAYLVYLNYYKNNCSITRKRKIAAIKTFFKWIYINVPGIRKENPTTDIPTVQSIVRLPKYLSLKEAKTIQNIFNKRNCIYYIRNNTIITLFLTTGIRLNELINIKLQDIDFEKKSINIVCKGNKERVVYFSEHCKQQLLKYLSIRSNANCKEDFLFLSNQNKRISKGSVESICKKAYKLMGLENKNYTVHTLRHTAATIYFEFNNRDILLLKEILGHSTILSTEIYTHTYNNLVKEAINKNPLNNFVKVA